MTTSIIALITIPMAIMAQQTSAERQITEAVSPLPESMRAGATVLGYQGGNTLVVLREGANAMICVADRPGDPRWHVACYHKDLDPFMARGRELRAEGTTELSQINNVRRAEIESGALEMPRGPRALYSLTVFDSTTGTGARGLYVVYLPYATEETVGISAAPASNRPWLMFPGEPWAHVMIARP